MKQQVYALYDNASQQYMRPIFVNTVAVLVRDITDEIKKGGEGNTLASHTTDFDLYELGTYDTDEGTFALRTKPEFIFNLGKFTNKPLEAVATN